MVSKNFAKLTPFLQENFKRKVQSLSTLYVSKPGAPKEKKEIMGKINFDDQSANKFFIGEC